MKTVTLQNATFNLADDANAYQIALFTRIETIILKEKTSDQKTTKENADMLHDTFNLLANDKVIKTLDDNQLNLKIFNQNIYAIKKLKSLLAFIAGHNSLDAYVQPALDTIKLFINNGREIYTSLDSRKSFEPLYIHDESERALYGVKKNKNSDKSLSPSTCDTQASSNSVLFECLNIIQLLSVEERKEYKKGFTTHKINKNSKLLKAYFKKAA